MAPGLNGRQTGTVPKNKSKNSGSQSHRLPRESFNQLSMLDLEPMSDLTNKGHPRNRSSTAHSETEADSIRHELGASRSSVMSSQLENGEGCSQENIANKMNIPDRKQVVNKLSQIQNYVQQTAALMNALKVSESPAQKAQYDKLSLMLEDLKDSESKLSGLLDKMDSAESRIGSLMNDVEELQPNPESGDSKRMQKFNRIVNENYGAIMCTSNMGNNNVEADEEELARRQEESKKKLEALQKRKQDLLKLQEKAKKQLQEAQLEQSRLVARASSLNQELSTNKVADLNVQNLSQRLKAVQQLYNTRNQINDTLVNRRSHRNEAEHPDEDQIEMSDTETDFQLVADKMDELNAMKAQLGQIQKLMASINGVQTGGMPPGPRESSDDAKEQTNQNSQNSSFNDCEQNGEDGNNNVMKLEQTKSKLNHLTQLLEIVQTAQSTSGLSPTYLQLVSNLVNEEAGSSSPSPSPVESIKSPHKNTDGISAETMQVMTRELEETTAAMKEERDKLLAARQELQDLAKRLPLNKPDVESLSPDDYSESEPPILKPVVMDTNTREVLNGSVLTEADQSLDCTEGSVYLSRAAPPRGRQKGAWNLSLSSSNFSTQERRSKNESLSRNSNQSSRGPSRSLGRDSRTLERESRWSPSPSITYSNADRQNPLIQTQSQLQMSSNLCELMLTDSLQRGTRPGEISLQEMFAQHQLLTRTVAQCSQLIWLQQKQIIELRNAMMLQCGALPNFQHQQITSSQPSVSVPVTSNTSCPVLPNGPVLSTANQVPPAPFHHHQNFHPANQNSKMNAGEIQNLQVPLQEFPELFSHQINQSSMHYMSPEAFGYDMRSGNFNRFNPSTSNANQNSNQNVSSGTNNRVPNGLSCLAAEDSGALNNQVPPGNRANNYWDNFRSYSRQNLLSNTKSNEDTDTSRRCHTTASLDRPPRDAFIPPLSQNNQSASSTVQLAPGNCESVAAEQYLLPPSQNTRINHHSQVARSRSVEPHNHRNPGKNESRHQENDTRNLNVAGKNDCSGGARSRNPDCGSDSIRSVRNDVNQSLNLNNSRNFVQMVRDFDNEEVPQGNNKKRLERARCRNDGGGVLNNRGYYNTSLWDNISSEVSSFIRANDIRPHFLLQLFRDLQQVTTDNLRQRTLESIQETVSANNLTERTSNTGGGNVNIIENRNNIRENRSNLNRNQSEDPTRIDELFYHLRENQNTIRQNIGMSSFNQSGNNLENPNISNIRDLGNSRNNLESEGLRDLRTYFEANLCNFGHNSALENPNLSNIRENLTRRGPGTSDMENLQPKNVYLSIYDNAAVEMRRRNQEHEFGSPFRNFEVGNDYSANEISGGTESVRASNNQFDLGNSFEGAVGGRPHFPDESRPTEARFPILDSGDNFGRSRQFLTNGNDSGIDINFNSDERKRSFVEGDGSVNDRTVKSKKNDTSDVEGAAALVVPQWERNSARDTSFDSSSLSLARNDMTSPFIPICDNSFFNCRTCQQDNGDLAEADQSRNEETSGAESDGFINAQIVEPENGFANEQNLQSPGSSFVNQNIPESERSFLENQNCENGDDMDAASGAEPEGNINFPSSASEPEGNFIASKESCENILKNESNEGLYYQFKPSASSENQGLKQGVKHRKKMEEAASASGETKKSSTKNSTNKFRDGSFAQAKFNGLGPDDFENQKVDSDSSASVAEGRQSTESRDSLFYGGFQLFLDKSAELEEENFSPEVDSDWECGSVLDQVPTRLNKSESSLKSDEG